MSPRKALRALAPDGMRIAVAQARRSLRDSGLLGPRPRLAARPEKPSDAGFDHCVLEIVQDIKGGAFLEGKLANIRLGAARLDGVVVAPREVLSFWKLVGSPSAAAGFSLGRSIRAGILGGEIGGGLCQVSGILYEAGLRAGMAVVERHPHSRDLYAEEDRFTPLGLDATIVWPYKDLRLLNPLAVPIRFGLAVRKLAIAVTVHAPIRFAPATLEIERVDRAGWREVRVHRRTTPGIAELISDDLYPFLEIEPA